MATMKNVRSDVRNKLYKMLLQKKGQPEGHFVRYYTITCLHSVFIRPFVESRNGYVLEYETINLNTHKVSARTWYECNRNDLMLLGLKEV